MTPLRHERLWRAGLVAITPWTSYDQQYSGQIPARQQRNGTADSYCEVIPNLGKSLEVR